MAFMKTANAEIADLISLPSWEKMHGGHSFKHKTASTSKLAADVSKYLLSHVTIMASVHCEDEPEDWKIRPEASIFCNQNQDAWANPVLQLSYRTFVGAFNFVEHYQNSKAAKGHILDAVLRKVNITPTVWVYYCDLLVATDLNHESLIADIRSGKMKYLSMGCLTDLVICSFCGARCTEAHTYCTHLLYHKGDFQFDEGGIPRRIAELCGHKSLPMGGVKFVEASWVATPAFPGAAKRSIVLDEWVGPKSPYTHLAAGARTGILKAATTSALGISAKLDAQFNKRF